MENLTQNSTITQIREYTFQVLDKNANVNVYTNISRLYRIEQNIKKIIDEDKFQNIDLDALFLALYISTIEQAELKLKKIDFNLVINNIKEVANNIKVQFNIDAYSIEKATKIAIEALPDNKNKLILEAQIISDAEIKDFACDKGRERLKLMYEQMVLKDMKISKSNWYDILLPILENYKTYTNYAEVEIKPALEKLYKSIKKEKKDIEERNELLVQKELKISDEEIKKLKKELSKTKERDDRGIQTLFRTTLKNHYTLNRMVDSKAKIMITVNSIILSLVLGGIIGNFNQNEFVNFIPILLFSIVNLISITFAILAIRPLKTQGNFSEEEIRSKKGNLLYFGNFHNMQYRDFEWGFLQLLNDRNYLYTSMIRDYYYQAKGLNKKYKYIRISLNAFLIGLAFSLVTQLLFKIM